jgi:hypothetical protein
MEEAYVVFALIIGAVAIGGLAGFFFRFWRGAVPNRAYVLMIAIPVLVSAILWRYGPPGLWRIAGTMGIGFLASCVASAPSNRK